MKNEKYILEKVYQDYKYAFSDWVKLSTKVRIKGGYYDIKDIHKKIEWNKMFDAKNKKVLDKYFRAEKKFLNMAKPELHKSYLNFIKDKVDRS